LVYKAKSKEKEEKERGTTFETKFHRSSWREAQIGCAEGRDESSKDLCSTKHKT
jgi:hypothetical protein